MTATAEAFAVSLSAPTNPFANNVLTRCVGSSHAATALRADWQHQLTKAQKDLGTEFVRFHGLLDDDMSVLIESEAVLLRVSVG